ncbi:MAG TPA: choice-of-anchor V domain-containing protein [Bryobacteraceae bacterium]|nr:choice-of-anchor V domain-containing protein [Bryobacteraceae bacterium]
MTSRRTIPIRIFQFTLLLSVGSVLAWAFSYGASHGKTTAPGDKPGVGCTGCHKGTPLNGGGGSVSLAFANGLTYTPGQTQIFTVTIQDAVATHYGFQMTARVDTNPANQQAGSFTAGAGQKVICADELPVPAGGCANNGIQWIEQTMPYQSPTNSFTIQWTAPPANAGNVHLYIVANAAQGGPQPLGDHIYSAEYVLVPPPLSSGGTAPTISPGGVVNGASFGVGIQSRAFVSIFGSNFTTSAPVRWDGSITGGVFPTTLAGVTVSIDGKPAPISYVDPKQINVLAPASSVSGVVNVVVSNAYGSSEATPVSLLGSAPAFFTFSGGGGRYIAAQIAQPGNPTTYEYLAPVGFLGNSTVSQPARPGDIIVLYGTGFGPTSPAVDPTLIFTGAASTTGPVAVTIGGIPAAVQFAGISAAGLYQLNVVVPQGLTSGDQPVVATTSDGGSTAQQVYIPVQP